MRVTIVFCEGPHDIHFAARSVIHHHKQVIFVDPASDLPKPFGWKAIDLNDKQEGLVLSQSRRNDSLSFSLERMNFGQKPLFELAIHDVGKLNWMLFVNMGGDTNNKEVGELITRIHAAMKTRKIEVSQIAFAFLFDGDFLSDKKGCAWRRKKFVEDYGPLLGLKGELSPPGWIDTGECITGLWIHAGDAEEGTLEDYTGALASADECWRNQLNGAQHYLEANLDTSDPIREKRDKSWKARLTIAGQLRKSVVGAGLTMVIQTGLDDALFEADVCMKMAAFLTSAPWK